MMQLFIEGLEVDTFGNETVVGTFAANEIGKLQTRQGVYSNTFRLPYSNNNRTIFQSPEVMTSTSTRPYRVLSARVDVNGVTQVIGWAFLKAAGIWGYELHVVGGNSDWYVAIGDKSLQDLDLVEGNHYFTKLNVEDSMTITSPASNNPYWTMVYAYANCEYGRTLTHDTATPIYPKWYLWRAGVYGKYLLWKILQEAGFTPDGTFWNNNVTLWDEANGIHGTSKQPALFLPFSARWRRDRDYSLRNQLYADTPVSTNIGGGSPIWDMVCSNVVSSSQWQFLHPSDNVITVLDSVNLTFRIKVTVENQSGATSTLSSWALTMYYTDDAGTPQTDVLIPALSYPTIPIGGTYTDEFTITRSMSRTQVSFQWGYNPLTENGALPDVTLFEFEIEDYVPLELTDEELDIDETFCFVTMASTLPDIKQADFIRTLFNQFCLIFNTNHQTGRVEIFTLDDVVGNIPNAVDWSNKLDLSEPYTCTFSLQNYGQSSIFKYKDDEQDKYTYLNEAVTQGAISVDDETLDTKVVVFESEFAASVRQSDSFNGFTRLLYIPKYRLLDGIAPVSYDPNADSNFEELDPVPRLCLIRWEDLALIKIGDGAGGYFEPAYQPALHFLGLQWSTLLPEYYVTLTSMLDRAKIVSCLIRLTEIDIAQLDFSRPVWVQHFESYFYINQIKQFKFTSRDSTEVELIKIG